MDVGRPTLASTLLRAGLIDEVRLLVNPVVLGADQSRAMSASLYARRLYELLARSWPTVESGLSATPAMIGFALKKEWVLARPTGVTRSRTHSEFRLIPIQGADDWNVALPSSA